MTNIAKNAEVLRARVAAACEKAGRDVDSVSVIAVAKTFPIDAVAAAVAAGFRHIGENYVQEAEEKKAALADLSVQWHFLGRLQSNKAAAVARLFDWVHSVDRLSIARRLSAARLGMSPLKVFVQVNVDNEPGKGGVSPAEVGALAQEISQLPNLQLVGLMNVPPAENDPLPSFQALATLGRDVGLAAAGLSMGMSGDFEKAILAGATHIRVGTVLFGERVYKSDLP